MTSATVSLPDWTRWIWGRHPRRTLVRAAVLAAALWLGGTYVIRPARVDGRSMEPTVHDGDLIWIRLWRYRWSDPRPGDIVAVRMAGPHAMYLKRVLAVPGERLRFENGDLWVNGQPRPEPYVARTGASWTLHEVALAPGEYFVAGDNREAPLDQHVAGITDRRRIVGGWTP